VGVAVTRAVLLLLLFWLLEVAAGCFLFLLLELDGVFIFFFFLFFFFDEVEEDEEEDEDDDEGVVEVICFRRLGVLRVLALVFAGVAFRPRTDFRVEEAGASVLGMVEELSEFWLVLMVK